MANLKKGVQPLGDLEPLEVTDKPVPKVPSFWKLWGLGIAFTSFALGSGELIFWPSLSNKVGSGIMWWALLGLFAQLWINLEAARYTMLTGESIIQGFMRIKKWLGWFWFGIAFFTNAWTVGYILSAATPIARFIAPNFPAGWDLAARSQLWTVVLLVIVALGFFLIPIIFKVIEKLGAFFGFLITFAFICICFIYWPGYPYASEWFKGLAAPSIPAFKTSKDWWTFASSIAYAGIGGISNILYASYYVREKNAAMGAYVGRVTNPITGEPEAIPATGVVPRWTKENISRLKKWWRWLLSDQSVWFFGASAITLLTMSYMAFVSLRPKGLVIGGWELVTVQSEAFTEIFGIAGTIFYSILVLFVFFDVPFSLFDSTARLGADCIFTLTKRGRKWLYRNWYYLIVAALIIVAFIELPFQRPAWYILLRGNIALWSMAIYTPLIAYLNFVKVPKELKLPKEVQPSWIYKFFFGVFDTIFYIVICSFYTLKMIGVI